MSTFDFQTKFSTLENLLFAFAMKLTRNQDRAKDLMQETAFRAFRHRSKFRPGTNFKAWVTTIMRNTFINNYRRKKTRNQVEAPIEEYAFALESKTIQNGASNRLMMQELMDMLDTLSDLYKVPFLMHHKGFQYMEIAEQLDIPIGTVKSRIFFARRKMKEMIYANYGKDFRIAS
ncbi:MAG: RNA polymerase sigma factor [Saprospiraceae bacterium]